MNVIVNMQGPSVGIVPVLELADGWRWVRLMTDAALEAEMQALEHLVSPYRYDWQTTAPQIGVYSLRDAENNPHVTAEVRPVASITVAPSYVPDDRGNVLWLASARRCAPPWQYASQLLLLLDALGVSIHLPAGEYGFAWIDSVLVPVGEAIARLAQNQGHSGDVDFGCYEGFIELSHGIKIGGNLNLGECHRLRGLPRGLNVGGDLNLSGCYSLGSLEVNLEVGGDLDFTYCENLDSLSGSISVGGNLILFGCATLESLPQNLKVGGDLDIRECASLTRLPRGLKVSGDFSLDDNPERRRLPQGLEVGGTLDLRDCASLTRLPTGLKVGGNLDITGCTSLTRLPKGLEVGGKVVGGDHLIARR